MGNILFLFDMEYFLIFRGKLQKTHRGETDSSAAVRFL